MAARESDTPPANWGARTSENGDKLRAEWMREATSPIHRACPQGK